MKSMRQERMSSIDSVRNNLTVPYNASKLEASSYGKSSFASAISNVSKHPPPKPEDYELISTIGSGSFGDVFLVKDLTNGQVYALKSLKKSVIISRKLVRYAMTEKNVLSQLYHPFMIRLHKSFQSNDRLILVMEYCERGDLGDLLYIEKRFSESRARDYL